MSVVNLHHFHPFKPFQAASLLDRDVQQVVQYLRSFGSQKRFPMPVLDLMEDLYAAASELDRGEGIPHDMLKLQMESESESLRKELGL